ncbi:hypothetical protein SJAV_19500 [Sulfurisphaera javensis]|uniref:Uncharacterized protein n=1 Tax=Sulfurisphaera javensis TaxID=2049879 RepID=A0AAT9GT21_9CREN
MREYNVITEAEFANDGKAHTYFMVFDEKTFYKVESILGKTSFDLHSLQINKRLERQHLQKIVMYKKAYDKEDLFNPGKINIERLL